jgi:hypothetical protein
MRKLAILFCSGVAALCSAPAAMAFSYEHAVLTKPNLNYSEFVRDRNTCGEDSVMRKWTPGVAQFSYVTYDTGKFARCMAMKGYRSDPHGYDTGPLMCARLIGKREHSRRCDASWSQ